MGGRSTQHEIHVCYDLRTIGCRRLLTSMFNRVACHENLFAHDDLPIMKFACVLIARVTNDVVF